jgi:hypothetical protein
MNAARRFVVMRHLPTWIWIAGAAFAAGALIASLF